MAVIPKKSWRPGRLAKNTMLLGTGMGLRALAQGLVFLIVARTLGTQGYGAFSAVLAVAGVWINFSGVGGHVLLVRDVARDPGRFPQCWGLTLAGLAISMLPVIFLYGISVWRLLSGVPCLLLVSLGMAELLFCPLTNTAASAYRGFERMGRSARLMLTLVLARLGAALMLALVALWQPVSKRLALWGWLYGAASLLAAVYAVYLVTRDLGWPYWPRRQTLVPYLISGLPFSLWGGASKLHVDADKFLLARMTSLEVTGTYSAGYRFVDLALMPLHALLDAAAPRLFRAGAEGVPSTLRASMPLVWPALGYALSIGAGLSLAAPLIPHLLGEAYITSVDVVRWLSWLPLVGLPRLLLLYAVATGDAQRQGMVTVLAGAIFNVILTIWWVPLWGWRGAAAATYVSEVIMTLILAVFLWRKTLRMAKRAAIASRGAKKPTEANLESEDERF